MKTFGEILRKERKALGLTQVKLNEKLGMGVNCVSMWEREKAEPKMFNLIVMSDFFNVSIDYLVGISEHREKIK